MSEETDEMILTVEQARRFLFCPRQLHLSRTASESELRAWKDREAFDELPAWPSPPAPVEDVEILSNELPVSGSLRAIREDGAWCPALWHGTPPSISGIWPDHEQECALATRLLRDQGCEVGPAHVFYRGETHTRRYTASEEQLDRIPLLLASAVETLTQPDPPPPFEDSPRCGTCSLVGLCLPDETLDMGMTGGTHRVPTRMLTPRDDALPFHVQEQGAKVGRSGETLVVTKSGKVLAEVLLKDLSQLVIHGNVFVTAQTIHLLANTGIPLVHLSTGGWFYGITQGLSGGDVALRQRQYALTGSPEARLPFARLFVTGKIANQRSQLRRNGRDVPEHILDAMSQLEKRASTEPDIDSLRGLEGMAAHHYFASFDRMLRPRPGTWDAESLPQLRFEHRNRRPPRDPVNALLSYAYAILAKECTVAVAGAGLDPLAGFFHAARPGRPSLALDLMEEFRPVAADSAVATALNTGMVGPDGFQHIGEACWLSPAGRKGIIQAWENRLDQLATHPIFDYRCSLRRIIRLQARLLARMVRGDADTYIPYRIR